MKFDRSLSVLSAPAVWCLPCLLSLCRAIPTLVFKTGGPCLFIENACCKKRKDYPAFACSPHNSSTGCCICALSVAPPRSSGTVSSLPAPGAGTRLRGPKKQNERRRCEWCFFATTECCKCSLSGGDWAHDESPVFFVVPFFVSAGVASSSSSTSSRATAALRAIFLRLDLLPQAGATASSATSFCSVRFFFSSLPLRQVLLLQRVEK